MTMNEWINHSSNYRYKYYTNYAIIVNLSTIIHNVISYLSFANHFVEFSFVFSGEIQQSILQL